MNSNFEAQLLTNARRLFDYVPQMQSQTPMYPIHLVSVSQQRTPTPTTNTVHFEMQRPAQISNSAQRSTTIPGTAVAEKKPVAIPAASSITTNPVTTGRRLLRRSPVVGQDSKVTSTTSDKAVESKSNLEVHKLTSRSHRPVNDGLLETSTAAELKSLLMSDEQMTSNGYPSNFDVNMSGFVRTSTTTLPRSPPMHLSAEVTALLAVDCEMVSTRTGKELARCTVVNARFELLYDALCRPVNDILSYNTAFSGLTKETLKDVTKRLQDVQNVC
jgi:hypothetical protein